jgi:hypothetical protein
VRAAFAACIPSAAAAVRQRRKLGASEIEHWGVAPAAAAVGAGREGTAAGGSDGPQEGAKRKALPQAPTAAVDNAAKAGAADSGPAMEQGPNGDDGGTEGGRKQKSKRQKGG